MESEANRFPIVVQKFGGTTITGISAIANIETTIRRPLESGFKVVAVVSAMGRGPKAGSNAPGDPYATDTLLALLPKTDESICLREKDLLMMCGEIITAVVLASHLRDVGISTQALTGFEAGILTDEQSCDARIQTIIPTRIFNELEHVDVVVVAGFQGIAESGKITTLGRGGSDTTAIALGHALSAASIEIYTDQQGVFSADPRSVPAAVHLRDIYADDIVHMSWAGAKVLHPRAAELIQKFRLTARVGQLTDPDAMTTISVCDEYEPHRLITAVTQGNDVSQFTVDRSGDSDQSHLLAVFSTVTQAGVSMDMFTVTETLVRFTVDSACTDRVSRHLHARGWSFTIRTHCRKISIVGAGMHGIEGVMARFTKSLV
ncbi:aspartate kinase, partial [bacterium]|nr:aspartate kinase [candidate division CSSED10-310 bacterium]